MKKIVLIFQLMLLTIPLFGGVVNQEIKKIPSKDILLIREFVALNFKWNQMAHVIFFHNKPVCLCTSFLKSPELNISDIIWNKGFESFKKYEHLFSHPNFLFISHVREEDENGYQPIDLYIINKKTLKKCFDQYQSSFQSVLGAECSYDWFLSQLEERKNLEEVIKHDQTLLGILLGYGEESSKAFSNHQNQRLEYFFLRTDVYCCNSPKTPEQCECFPVTFMGNPNSKDVKHLMKIYQNEMETFWNLYQKKDPLVLFFEGICEDEGDVLQSTFTYPFKANFRFDIYTFLP